MPRYSSERFPFRLSWTLLVKVYLVYGLCMDSDVFVLLFGNITSTSSGDSSLLHSGNSNPLLFGLTALFMIWTLALILPVYRTVIMALIAVPWFTAVYVEALGSVLWSAQASNTFRYGITLWVYMLCGLIVSLYLTTETIIRTISNIVFGLALLSIPAQYIYPQDNAAPGWTGSYGEKNHLGIGMTIGLIALVVPRTKWTAFRVFKAIVMCALLLLSQSGTALVCTIAVAIVLVLLRTGGRLRRFIVVCTSGTLVLASLLVPDLLTKILAVGGKNTTLTGRDVIWRFSLQQWGHKPLLGWGYTAFWADQEALVYQTLHWMPGHSHNGFLEIGLALGIVGVIIILMILVTATRFAFFVRHSVNETAGTWLLCSLTILILHNFTEVDFLLPAPLWFTFTVVLFSALRDSQEYTRARRLSRTQSSSRGAFNSLEPLRAV